MGHDKLRKFKENEGFGCLLQPSSESVLNVRDGVFGVKDHEIKGHWDERMFGGSGRPIVLELGCGRGEYTVDLALRNGGFNYIGVDIKGARLWKGAKYAHEHNLPNVAFLRTRVEFVEAFFAPGEVSEIWLTFSDPQLKSENNRLTSRAEAHFAAVSRKIPQIPEARRGGAPQDRQPVPLPLQPCTCAGKRPGDTCKHGRPLCRWYARDSFLRSPCLCLRP